MIYIEFLKHNKIISLQEGFDIEMYHPFPVISDGEKDITLNIKIPRLFSSIFELPDLTTDRAEYWEVLLLLGNTPFRSGLLRIVSFDEEYFDCTILINSRSYAPILGKKLSELDFGGWRDWIWKTEYLPEIDGFALPTVEMKDFFRNSIVPDEPMTTLNGRTQDNTDFYLWEGSYAYTGYMNAIVPFPQVDTILKYIAKNIAVESSDFFENIPNLIIASNYDVSEHIINSTTDHTYYNNISSWNMANHVPDISVQDFFERLSKFFGLYIDIQNEKLIIEPVSDVLENGEYIDISDRIVSTTENMRKPYDSIVFSMRNIVGIPQIAEENRKIIQTTSSTFPSIAEKWEYLVRTNTNTGNIEIYYNAVYTNINLVLWKNIEELYPEQDSIVFRARQDYADPGYGENILKIETGCDIMVGESENGWVNKLPGAGIVSFQQKKTDRIEPTFGLYRGKLSSDGLDGLIADFVNGTDRLDLWYQDGGIFYRYWKKIWDWLKTIDRTIVVTVYLSISEILSWDFRRKIYIDGRLFVVRSLKYTLEDKQYIKATMELWEV